MPACVGTVCAWQVQVKVVGLVMAAAAVHVDEAPHWFTQADASHTVDEPVPQLQAVSCAIALTHSNVYVNTSPLGNAPACTVVYDGLSARSLHV